MRHEIAVLLCMAANASGASVAFRKIYPPTNDVAVDHHVAIPMRDGAILYADVMTDSMKRAIGRAAGRSVGCVMS